MNGLSGGRGGPGGCGRGRGSIRGNGPSGGRYANASTQTSSVRDDQLMYERLEKIDKTFETRISDVRAALTPADKRKANAFLIEVETAVAELATLLGRQTSTCTEFYTKVNRLHDKLLYGVLLIKLLIQIPRKYTEYEQFINTVYQKIHDAKAASSLEGSRKALQALVDTNEEAIADLETRSSVFGQRRISLHQVLGEEIRPLLEIETLLIQMVIDCNTVRIGAGKAGLSLFKQPRQLSTINAAAAQLSEIAKSFRSYA
jgi:hypothetical protein